MAFFSSFGQTFFIALFNEQIREDFSLTHGGFGFWYSLATVASGFTIMWAGRLIDSFDLRLYAAIVALGLVVASFAMAAASVIAVLVVALFMLRLFGQGLCGHVAATSMARYFEADRGKALSIAWLGHPLGEAILPITAVALLGFLAWREAWLAIGVVLAVALVPTTLFLLRGHSARHAAYEMRLRETHEAEEKARAENDGMIPGARHQWTRGEVVRDVRFYLILPAALASAFLLTGLYFHQVHLVEEKGWSLQWYAAWFAGFAAAQAPAALLAGPLIDRFGATRILPHFLLPLAASTLLLAVSDHAWIVPPYLVLNGLTAGMAGTVISAAWAELYGVKHLGAIRALAASLMVFSTGASPVLMGLLIDAGLSMNTIAGLSCAYTLLAVTLVHVALRLPVRRSESVA